MVNNYSKEQLEGYINCLEEQILFMREQLQTYKHYYKNI